MKEEDRFSLSDFCHMHAQSWKVNEAVLNAVELGEREESLFHEQILLRP